MSVTIRACIHRQTDRAFLLDMDGEHHWVPKSQVYSIDGNPTTVFGSFASNTHYTFDVSDWIAQQKGFVLSEADEKYTADENRHGVPGVDLFAVRAGNEIIGFGPTYQKAVMLAAALNLTIGKV